MSLRLSYFHEVNLSWYTVPFAFFLALFPRIYFSMFGPGKNIYDPKNPRRYMNDLRKQEGMSSLLRGRLERSEAALANAFENLPLFAIAVLAANVEGQSYAQLNFLSLSYIGIRIFYTWLYIWGQEYQFFHPLTRTVVWFIAQGVIASLYLIAGEKYTYWVAKAYRLREGAVFDIV